MLKHCFCFWAATLLLALLISGCTVFSPRVILTSTPSPTATVTPVPPTPTSTPEPLALRVNDMGVTLADYQAELFRLQSAATELSLTFTLEEQRQRVLDSLTTELLLAQAARESGAAISAADVQVRIDQLAAKMGGSSALADWQTRMGYTDASFRVALERAMLASVQRDVVIAEVPETAEQIHARQIMLLDEATIQLVYRQVQGGADFTTQAFVYDPLSGGDLGWFPRGYLTQPDVETAAFALEVGGHSAVIKTSFGYHIIQVIERDPQRRLSPDARRVLQQQALAQWLEQRRAQSVVEILVP